MFPIKKELTTEQKVVQKIIQRINTSQGTFTEAWGSGSLCEWTHEDLKIKLYDFGRETSFISAKISYNSKDIPLSNDSEVKIGEKLYEAWSDYLSAEYKLKEIKREEQLNQFLEKL